MSEQKEDKVTEEMPTQDNAAFDPADFDMNDPLALDDVDTQLDQLIAERDDLKDRLIRSLAEAENIRKRGERDRRDAEIYGGTKLARDMLSVYDNLKRALDTVDDAQKEASRGLVEGIELTLKELLAGFTKQKITRLTPEVGDKFDPNLHQAMFEAPMPGVPAGNIIQTMTEGFKIGDRLLRPAQVGVSSTPTQDHGPTQD